MSSRFLFGGRIPPACAYCAHIMGQVPGGGQMLCEKRGVVAGDYSCGKYRYDPLRRVPPRARPLTQFTAEDFSLDIPIEEESQKNETQTIL